jgi:hypothetical protein
MFPSDQMSHSNMPASLWIMIQEFQTMASVCIIVLLCSSMAHRVFKLIESATN